jgi:cobaltochelatase CobN
MHLLATTATRFDEMAEPVDLRQAPGDMVVLSFADSDLAALAAAWELDKTGLPSLRVAHLRDLRHPMSVDLWIDRIARHAKVIVVRLLGGLEWWCYGIERLSALARTGGIALAVLPGEDRDDPRLVDASTLPAAELDTLLQFFREGGRENLRGFLRRMARHGGVAIPASDPLPVPIPRYGVYPLEAALDLTGPSEAGATPTVLIVFYRSLLLAADTSPIDELQAALRGRGLNPAAVFVPSLKDPDAAAFVRTVLARLTPRLVITTTGFAAGGDANTPGALDGIEVPVLQAVIATTKRAAWLENPRGLSAADMAMHVVLPELDGRVLSGMVAFKHPEPPHEALAFTNLVNRPEPDRIAVVADRAAGWVRLQQTPRSERRIAILMPDYPGAPGRTGYAVGLDVPMSVVTLLADCVDAGYAVVDRPLTSRQLLDALALGDGGPQLPLETYEGLLAQLPDVAVASIRAAWGNPSDDPACVNGAFSFRARAFGKVFVALAPDRGRSTHRRADYHDPALPPRHALLAFGLWLRYVVGVDALVHMGAHGTLEWLPGKAVALTAGCFPELVTGSLPVIYPFIVSNPGEAAQAKRRIAALTIGHLPPPLVQHELTGQVRALERLLEEYAAADGLDRRRRERLAKLVVETARQSGLARQAGAHDLGPDEALVRIDAWLCDLKDFRAKDGLHVYGRAAQTSDPRWAQSGEAERLAMRNALDGRRVLPGPAGAPGRQREDVLPTGRNLFTVDPRALPTATAMDLGQLAADELLRNYLQTHGEPPRALVVDLWGSATLRTGGEEIAQGFWLMGCRPIWDRSCGRVTGVEVVPCAALGRPRIDVTWRVSGLFRDLFPAQLALIDAAVRAVAGREESDQENPLAALQRAEGKAGTSLARVFGTAPGAYGAGIEDLLGCCEPRVVGAAYLAAASHAYGGAEGASVPVPGAFAKCVAKADLLVHASDDPGRDLLEGSADLAFVGGFAAAAAVLGRAPDLVMLDTTDPGRPRPRSLGAALARIVHSRANPRWVEGQMRHGPRGAAELAELIDRLVGFAELTDAVPDGLIDLVHQTVVADKRVQAFLVAENPAAAQAIADRLEGARRHGRWHPRRNDLDAGLMALRVEMPT